MKKNDHKTNGFKKKQLVNLPAKFDWKLYLKLNPDIADEGYNTEDKIIYHYLNFGLYEKRTWELKPDDNFNWKTYLLANPDLVEKGIYKKNEATEHYLMHGRHEGRPTTVDIPEDFNWRRYIKLNTDLDSTFTKKEALMHYVLFGKTENRSYLKPNNNEGKQEIIEENSSPINNPINSAMTVAMPLNLKKIQPKIVIRPKRFINITSKDTFRDAVKEEEVVLKQMEIPSIQQNLPYETVLIEFRYFDHLEALIINMILKLPNWSHTIICGINNYDKIFDLCATISDNIKIIKLPETNLTPSDYSSLLMKEDFWNHFVGDKILIYQEDSWIFHNRIDPFLDYDYVGAPWPESQDDNSNGVGNGGFSLRSKEKMIQVIKNVTVDKLTLGNSTKEYMKSTNSYVLPEDVYFSKALIDFKIGCVAQRYIGKSFSQESIQSQNPLGGHNFWLAAQNLNISYKTLALDEDNNYYKSVDHRGGWNSVINYGINNLLIKEYKDSIYLIDCCEKFFLWDRNRYEKPWVGIIHTTPSTPKHLTEILNIKKLFECETFRSSLACCKGLICLTQYQVNWVKKHVKYPLPRLDMVYHPIGKLTQEFDLSLFSLNHTFNIVLMGQQLRRITDLLKINTKLINDKIWLSGIKSVQDRDRVLKLELDALKLDEKHFLLFKEKIKTPYLSSHSDYDKLIQSSILVAPLFDAAANNSILECITSNTPIFVTRCPGAEEYLGTDYPMFFDSTQHLNELIADREMVLALVKLTHEYLLKLDKSKLTYKKFYSDIIKIINNI